MSAGRSAAPGLSPQRAVYLIARRELTTRILGKVFIVGTAVAVVLLAVYALLQVEVIDRITTTRRTRSASTVLRSAWRNRSRRRHHRASASWSATSPT